MTDDQPVTDWMVAVPRGKMFVGCAGEEVAVNPGGRQTMSP
jgi:hypothetical protein